jgi:uncharacterized protein YcfL
MKKVLLIIVLIFLVVGCSKHTQSGIEKKFEKVAVQYYEKELKGKVVGIDEYTITLKALKIKNYDVSGIVNAETNKECDETSSVIITVKDKSYETKVNLICK